MILLLAGLPVAVWLDLSNLADTNLRRQASDLNSVISSVRGYYASNVVGRILAAPGTTTQVVHNYENVPGAIPIPATLSLELGQRDQRAAAQHRLPLRLGLSVRQPRAASRSMTFETDALRRAARQSRSADDRRVERRCSATSVRLVAPVIMGAACVNCHNAHPESPKRDWKVGDVRGIQEVTITQPIAGNIFSFKYLLAYFVLVAAVGFTFIALQRRQAAAIQGMNAELETANEFLASLSMKISRYLSPQIYKSIFSGQKDVTIHTERKKLTIFFSDIKDFTATTERLQPEQITQLLNEYFTEMSTIALGHGGTIDKFVGDAMLIFFGDPETKGDAEDAKACLRMAVEMQHRLAELNAKWRNAGIEQPFRVRMGINTGYCNVGNFGSDDRMDYTIIGAEANLAARLQSIAEPGQHRDQLRNLRAGARHRRRAGAAADHDEGHQPRGRALRGQGHARRERRDDPGLQRAHHRARFLPQRQHDRRDQRRPHPQGVAGCAQGDRESGPAIFVAGVRQIGCGDRARRMGGQRSAPPLGAGNGFLVARWRSRAARQPSGAGLPG